MFSITSSATSRASGDFDSKALNIGGPGVEPGHRRHRRHQLLVHVLVGVAGLGGEGLQPLEQTAAPGRLEQRPERPVAGGGIQAAADQRQQGLLRLVAVALLGHLEQLLAQRRRGGGGVPALRTANEATPLARHSLASGRGRPFGVGGVGARRPLSIRKSATACPPRVVRAGGSGLGQRRSACPARVTSAAPPGPWPSASPTLSITSTTVCERHRRILQQRQQRRDDGRSDAHQHVLHGQPADPRPPGAHVGHQRREQHGVDAHLRASAAAICSRRAYRAARASPARSPSARPAGASVPATARGTSAAAGVDVQAGERRLHVLAVAGLDQRRRRLAAQGGIDAGIVHHRRQLLGRPRAPGPSRTGSSPSWAAATAKRQGQRQRKATGTSASGARGRERMFG